MTDYHYVINVRRKLSELGKRIFDEVKMQGLTPYDLEACVLPDETLHELRANFLRNVEGMQVEYSLGYKDRFLFYLSETPALFMNSEFRSHDKNQLYEQKPVIQNDFNRIKNLIASRFRGNAWDTEIYEKGSEIKFYGVIVLYSKSSKKEISDLFLLFASELKVYPMISEIVFKNVPKISYRKHIQTRPRYDTWYYTGFSLHKN